MASVKQKLTKQRQQSLKIKNNVHPGLRAERGASLHPIKAPRKPQNRSADDIPMLDSTPINNQHIAEMEDNSMSAAPIQAAKMRSPVSDTDSPTLGRRTSSTLANSFRRTKHLMSWNNYDAGHVDEKDDQEPLSGTFTVKTPPAQVSPDSTNGVRDSKFVVSPLGSFERKQG